MVNEVDMNLANELIPLTRFEWPGISVPAVTFGGAVTLFTLVWAIHVKKEDAGSVDFFWGGGVVLMAVLGIVFAGGATGVAVYLVVLLSIWALRLTIHMVSRHRLMAGEDSRYRAIRIKGGPQFWWRSLFTLYWVQAAVLWIIATPILAAILHPAERANLPLILVGTLLFAAGLLIETVADRQPLAIQGRPG